MYRISGIPLGGYVKTAGETQEEQREGKDDEFLSKTKWQRSQILIAGPAMIMLLAVVVTTVVLYQGAQVPDGLKPKDLCMMPARVALALQADGWWIRSEIIWAKPNPMPESVTDRPTSSHEKI